MKKPWYQQLWNWVKLHCYTISYIAVLAILTWYIVRNWMKCISMQFFVQFDGNNILFLVWIAAILLFFYDVEAKGWKFRKKGIEDTKRQLDNAEIVYSQKQRENRLNELQQQGVEGSVCHDEPSK